MRFETALPLLTLVLDDVSGAGGKSREREKGTESKRYLDCAGGSKSSVW
jgi:hypothetical protein